MDDIRIANEISRFSNLLHDDNARTSYKDKILAVLEGGEANGREAHTAASVGSGRAKDYRLILDIGDVREHSPDLALLVLTKPLAVLPALGDAVTAFATTLGAPEAGRWHVGFDGSIVPKSPRALSSADLHQMVSIVGIVTKCSLVRPKVVRSVHYCAATKEFQARSYADALTARPGGASVVSETSQPVYLVRDDENNPLTTEFGLSLYDDHQTIVLQEAPESAPAGQLPRSVRVALGADLVDVAKPGDRLRVTGAYRALPPARAGTGGTRSGIFTAILVANCVRLMSDEASGPQLTAADLDHVSEAARDPRVFDRLALSLAPSIWGHEHIKRAMLLQLLGGCEKILENKTHIRGDINILLVGDPSCGKSQLMRHAMAVAPLAISTSGRGSSGVGLTAAVTSDSETGERRLEGGAMVLGDRGIVLIDEFDKMSADDRVAIHEVMEQQTVTIAKAGIHTTLNARCSVFAAANPVYGHYNRTKKPAENVALPDSLLSRFDLLFIVLDTLAPAHDRRVADHVLRMHRFRGANQTSSNPDADTGRSDVDLGSASAVASAAATATDADDVEDDGRGEAPSLISSLSDSQQSMASVDLARKARTAPVYARFNRLLGSAASPAVAALGGELYSIQFVQKYILYAKSRPAPRLTQEAASYISSAYANLRNKEDARTLPVTARSLETMIRLSEAHAKCRLAERVEVQDAQVALGLLNYALYHEVGGVDGDGMQPRGMAPPEDVAAAAEAAAAEAAGEKRKRAPGDSGGRREEEEEDDVGASEEDRLQREAAAPAAAATGTSAMSAGQVRDRINAFFHQPGRSTDDAGRILDIVEFCEGATEADVRAALQQLHDEGNVFISGEEVLYI